jgi:phosphoribosylformylglycinamidine synthase
VVVFPGSNCDFDLWHALADVLEADARYVWHKESSVGDVDAVLLPGGFSYGDYLRCGAIARFSPVMESVIAFAREGGPVLGVCNGFQILCEAGLLPGALVRNAHMRFECRDVHVRVETTGPWTRAAPVGEVLRIPIAHAEGRYVADVATLDRLEQQGLVALRYCDPNGGVTDAANPNGSTRNIAGIYNEKKNVMGLMPHPERLCEEVLGGTDGRAIFASILGRPWSRS